MLNLTIQHSKDDTVILRCQGRIVSGEETAILCTALAQHRSYIALDLTEVTAMDAAGIGVLVSLQAAGIYLQLLNPTPQVRELLRVTQLDTIFEISETAPVGQELASTSVTSATLGHRGVHAGAASAWPFPTQ
jgi:anti-anti-sigma factor